MAIYIKHRCFLTLSTTNHVLRNFATKVRKPNPDKKKTPTIETNSEILSNRGFLRSLKPYQPSEDVTQKFNKICSKVLKNETTFNDPLKKYEFLSECNKEFNHCVPNSMLHEMENTNDVLKFYKTPINTTVPLDMMKHMDLPENIHIQYEYNRFHPDTDTMFNGVTAFPRSSTLVTGLKYKKKYTGFEARTSWPFNT